MVKGRNDGKGERKDQKARVDAGDRQRPVEVGSPRVSPTPRRGICSTVTCSLVQGLHCVATIPGGEIVTKLRLRASLFIFCYCNCHSGAIVGDCGLLLTHRAAFV